MNGRECTNRRTVLKAIPATVVGGQLVVGTAGARGRVTRDGACKCGTDLEIVAEHDHETDEHRFELASHELTAGWTTVTFDNRTDHTHFAYLAAVPEEAIAAANEEGADLLEYYVEHVTRPFQWFMDDIDPEAEPDPDDLSDEYTDLDEEVIFPPWFDDVLPSGGTGLTSGHTTSRATVNLDPGEYVVECYVKDEDGVFHSYLGMIDVLTVRDERVEDEPEATVELSLSTAGIAVDDAVAPGEQTVAVRVEDQQVYEHLLGHDVHLLRFDESTTVADVNGWMNWMDPDGLVSDGTEPGTFLGGVQTILTPRLLEGGDPVTAYFDATLNPGAYAWVSEVPNPSETGMLKPFIVPFDQNGR